MPDGSFLVLLEDPTSLALKAPALAKVVAKALAIPTADAAQRVRYGGGIVGRDLPEDAARRVASALAAEGHSAFALETARYEAPPRPRRLVAVLPGKDGIVARSRGVTREETLAWSRVRAVYAYALARELAPEEAEARKSRPKPDPKEKSEARQLLFELYFWEDQERTRRIELALDVVVDQPLALLRLSVEDADYRDFEGRTGNAYDNFVALVRAIIAKAPATTVIPPSTRAFATTLDWRTGLFDKPEERDSFTAWVIQAARHGKPFGLVPNDEPIEDLEDSDLEESGDTVESDDDPDAEEVSDDELDAYEEEPTEVEDDEDEEDEDDDEPAPPKGQEKKPVDPDVQLALDLADKTGRLKMEDVQEIIAAAEQIPELGASDDVAGGPAVPELEHFEDRAQTARWNVSELASGAEELEDEELKEE
jgi:hypothetical protein